MIINSSQISMCANSKASVTYTETRKTMMKNLDNSNTDFSSEVFTNTLDKEEKKVSQDNKKEQIANLLQQLRDYLFNFRKKLMQIVGRDYSYGGYMDLSSGGNISMWRRTDYISYKTEEKHEMNFATKGKVIAQDGREIEFNMELSMSSEFVEECESIKSDVVAVMTDPLVINLNSNPISVSDQKWRFDIDADGEEDSISMLDEGAGYLVYDKNNDGRINDGTEMFGAKSGNGFADLAQYDEDKNGWIDEKDSIYNKLSVWKKDSSGNDKMLSLKEANVGAIYLANVPSEYAVKSKIDKPNAQIRRSGMYLTEDGKSRSIQQLDMVKALIS